MHTNKTQAYLAAAALSLAGCEPQLLALSMADGQPDDTEDSFLVNVRTNRGKRLKLEVLHGSFELGDDWACRPVVDGTKQVIVHRDGGGVPVVRASLYDAESCGAREALIASDHLTLGVRKGSGDGGMAAESTAGGTSSTGEGAAHSGGGAR